LQDGGFFASSGERDDSFSATLAAVKYGYHCEECEEAIWPAAPRPDLQWLKDRTHLVREVASHSHGGLDTWLVEGLAFLDDHAGHDLSIVSKT